MPGNLPSLSSLGDLPRILHCLSTLWARASLGWIPGEGELHSGDDAVTDGTDPGACGEGTAGQPPGQIPRNPLQGM